MYFVAILFLKIAKRAVLGRILLLPKLRIITLVDYLWSTLVLNVNCILVC